VSESKLSTREYLIALRNAHPFTRENIQEHVVRAARHLPREVKLDLPARSREKEYIRVLEDIGYRFAKPSGRLNFLAHPEEGTIPLFRTKYEVYCHDNSRGSVDRASLRLVADRARTVLHDCGFGSVFHSVIVTDDALGAFRWYLPDEPPLRYLKWYYLAAGRGAGMPQDVDPMPQGGLFRVGRQNVPLVFLMVPTGSMSVPVFEGVRAKLIHEIAHYYLSMTLFLSTVDHPYERVLEVAGETLSIFLLDLLDESFAHSDSASIIGSSYFKYVPADLPSGDTTLNMELSDIAKWARRKTELYWSTAGFMSLFPWAVALVAGGQEEMCQQVLARIDPPLQTAGQVMLPHILGMYERAELGAQAILALVQILEEILEYIHAWSSLETLFALYLEPDALSRPNASSGE